MTAAPADPQVTHLFEAEGHGEHADSDNAVHHVHDETRVRRRHFGAACRLVFSLGESKHTQQHTEEG